MNLLRKTATTLGGIFFAVLLIAALAPKATRGVAAALVQVTNTSASPVPTVSSDANFPYVALMCAGNCSDVSLTNSFSVPSTTTTGVAVKRLVIEDLNASCNSVTGVVTASLEVPAPADTNVVGPQSHIGYGFLLTADTLDGNLGHAIVRMYVDPSASVFLELAGAVGAHGQCFATLTGHLETK